MWCVRAPLGTGCGPSMLDRMASAPALTLCRATAAKRVMASSEAAQPGPQCRLQAHWRAQARSGAHITAQTPSATVSQTAAPSTSSDTPRAPVHPAAAATRPLSCHIRYLPTTHLCLCSAAHSCSSRSQSSYLRSRTHRTRSVTRINNAHCARCPFPHPLGRTAGVMAPQKPRQP
jgi:hypothetical protein